MAENAPKTPWLSKVTSSLVQYGNSLLSTLTQLWSKIDFASIWAFALRRKWWLLALALILFAANKAYDHFNPPASKRGGPQTISSVISQAAWDGCADPEVDLDPEKLTWLALDISPDRKHCALVGAQKLGDERFIVKLLHTWENGVQLDDREIANEAAKYCREYPIEYFLSPMKNRMSSPCSSLSQISIIFPLSSPDMTNFFI